MSTSSKRLYPERGSPRYYPLTRLRIELSRIASRLADHPAAGGAFVLLDYGCGDMPYRSLFTPPVERYLGLDLPHNELADFHIEHDALCPRLGEGTADVVLSTQVLEHVENPAVYLAECHRLLKDDGWLILSTHGYWPYHPSPEDYWRFTGAGLQKILEDAGFQITSFTGVMGLAATSAQLFQDAAARRVHPWLRPSFFWVMQRLVALLDRLQSPEQRALDASIFVALARKGARGPRGKRP